jgi:hypothetical protein
MTSQEARVDEFERDVLGTVIDRTPMADALRAQAAHATVVRREADVGSVTTYFCVPADSPRIDPPELTDGAHVAVEGLRGTAYAEVTIHNGWLDSLMVSAVGEPWPAHPRVARGGAPRGR